MGGVFAAICVGKCLFLSLRLYIFAVETKKTEFMRERIIRILLILLGFGAASCSASVNNALRGDDVGDGDGDFGHVAEYGAPMVMFTVKGRVVDAMHNPIPGIAVSVSPDEYRDSDDMFDVAQSGADGTFEGRAEFFGFGTGYVVHFKDLDGEDNGGLFFDKEVSIKLSEDDLTDQSTWTKGYSKDMGEVALDKNDENDE